VMRRTNHRKCRSVRSIIGATESARTTPRRPDSGVPREAMAAVAVAAGMVVDGAGSNAPGEQPRPARGIFRRSPYRSPSIPVSIPGSASSGWGAKYQRPSTRIISRVSSPALAVAWSPSIW